LVCNVKVRQRVEGYAGWVAQASVCCVIFRNIFIIAFIIALLFTAGVAAEQSAIARIAILIAILIGNAFINLLGGAAVTGRWIVLLTEY